ncbi:MAG TPA: hypothetical protein VFC38_04765 [Stellaceae bacterium]|nr:hypothetical protein [Stellaceae bacterium]
MADVFKLPDREDRVWKEIKAGLLQAALRGGASIGPSTADRACEHLRTRLAEYTWPSGVALLPMDESTTAAVESAISQLKLAYFVFMLGLSLEIVAATDASGRTGA